MITLYSGGTTRGLPPCIMLEELGADYELLRFNIGGNERDPRLLAVNPLGRIPVLQDENCALDQSAAILIYLAEKYGRFLPSKGNGRSEALRLMLHTATDIMPSHSIIFRLLRRKDGPHDALLALQRAQLLKDLTNCDRILQDREWLAGDVSIADFTLYPIVGQYGPKFAERHNLESLGSWIERMSARPGVQSAERKCPYDYDVSNTL